MEALLLAVVRGRDTLLPLPVACSSSSFEAESEAVGVPEEIVRIAKDVSLVLCYMTYRSRRFFFGVRYLEWIHLLL